MTSTVSAPPIIVPDRYESLVRRARDQLNTIVVPIEVSLGQIAHIFSVMRQADRGAFLLLRGASGAGKSTFLHTLSLYRQNICTYSVPGGSSVREYLQTYRSPASGIEIIVHEEREAAVSFSDAELEDWLHSINGFIRSERGRNSIVVWPCNSEPLKNRIVSLGRSIGGAALLGTGQGWLDFVGPDKRKFISIAESTLATLNQGATFSDLGLNSEQLDQLGEAATTIGDFLSRVHDHVIAAGNEVKQLVKHEQCRLWIIVAAGNDIASEVAALTRGRYAAIDTERLMSSTEANIVADLKTYAEKVGILGTVLDAKILHLPVLTASSIARAFADDKLKGLMRNSGLSLKPDNQAKAIERLQQAEIAALMKSGISGLLPRGRKPGSESVEAFRKLAEIASTNDVALNRAFGNALVAAKLIRSFTVEQDFGTGLTRRTDLLAETEIGAVRIELMWRKTTGRADIANYALTKVANYGRAIGFLNS